MLIVTLPLRATALRNNADLEHLGFGLSLWQDDGEQRYREASDEFRIYLPSGVDVGLPLRLAPAVAEPATAVLSLDGEVLATLTFSRDQWQAMDVRMPDRRARFELVTVSISGAALPPGSPVVRPGRAQPR